jgi:hypothetical protein
VIPALEPRPKEARSGYIDLRQRLDDYYTANPNRTDPRELSQEFAKILLAHDVSHIIFGCDTGMYVDLLTDLKGR